MLKAYKTEIKISKEQEEKLKRSIGTCRFIYNLYIATNIENYKKGGKFISAYDFSKWLNNSYLKEIKINYGLKKHQVKP